MLCGSFSPFASEEKKIPKWNQIDMDTFNKLYPYKRIGDAIKKANINIKIDISAFWRYALKNVLCGYLLRIYDNYVRK